MIRDKIKIYGERNDPHTCLAEGTLATNVPVVSREGNKLETLVIRDVSILIIDANGHPSHIPVPAVDLGKYKLLSTDANGNLVWIDK